MTPSSTYMRRMVWGILALALALRLGFLYRNWDNLDFNVSFMLHGEVARNILEGHWFQKDSTYLNQYVQTCVTENRLIDFEDYPPPEHQSLMPLYNDEGGYGAFVALTWKVFGAKRWWYVRVIQVLTDVLLCWMVYRIGLVLFGERVGLAAAFLYALFIPGMEIAVRPHRDFWVTALFVTSVFLLTRMNERRWFARFGGLGVASGIVAMMRSTVVPFVAFVGTALLVLRPSKSMLRCTAVLAAGFLIAFSPLLIRNYMVFGKLMATRGAFWHSFWGGVGQLQNPYGVLEDDADIARLAYRLDPGALFETERYEQVLKREALTLIAEHPVWYAASVVKRGVVFVFPRAGRALFFQAPLVQHRVGFVNTVLNGGFAIAVDLFLGISFLAALWWKRREWRAWSVVLIPYVYTLSTLAPFYVTGRNIANVYFVVLLFAAVTIVRIWDVREDRRRSSLSSIPPNRPPSAL